MNARTRLYEWLMTHPTSDQYRGLLLDLLEHDEPAVINALQRYLGEEKMPRHVIAEIQAGRKIHAIKALRTAHTNMMLKEAKDLVEDYISNHPEVHHMYPSSY